MRWGKKIWGCFQDNISASTCVALQSMDEMVFSILMIREKEK